MNLISYYESLGAELEALKNRIRYIMDDPHWLTDGEWKESVLKNVLRRHVPGTVNIGRGFIFTPERCSSQIDILIYDNSYPILFKDGDLVFITPDAVCGIIEVKSKVDTNILRKAIPKLSENARLINSKERNCFVGLFSYEVSDSISDYWVLKQLRDCAEGDKRNVITHLSMGKSKFFRFWDIDPGDSRQHNKWHSYQLNNLAPSYFINNVLASISRSSITLNQEAWFPGESKERRKIEELYL